MQKEVIRIQNVELFRFKNVEYGKVGWDHPAASWESRDESDVLGIYGQNGSGKSAFVEAMYIARRVLSGRSLPEHANDFIYCGETNAEIRIEFRYHTPEKDELLFYEMCYGADETGEINILRERVSCKPLVDGKWRAKHLLVDYEAGREESILPRTARKVLLGKDPERRIDVEVAMRLALKNKQSVFFSKEMCDLLNETTEFRDFEVFEALRNYAMHQLIIIGSLNLAEITLSILLPKGEREALATEIGERRWRKSLLQPIVLPIPVLRTMKRIIHQLNTVLQTVIPGLTIGVRNYGLQLTEDGLDGERIELTSRREGVEVPLRNESEGIKKIIAVLGSMVRMFHNEGVCLIVDELDAGIFEYLLGEMLQIVDEAGRGQLMFTSHNLRPLETLHPDAILFTTTDPKARYRRIKNTHDARNLRELYYRNLHLGGEAGKLYRDTDSYAIHRAFREAGRLLDEE